MHHGHVNNQLQSLFLDYQRKAGLLENMTALQKSPSEFFYWTFLTVTYRTDNSEEVNEKEKEIKKRDKKRREDREWKDRKP